MWNGEHFRPTPDDFEKLFASYPCEDSDIMELTKDYRYYIDTGQHRRLAVWRDHHRLFR
jgi:hypothetical protein